MLLLAACLLLMAILLARRGAGGVLFPRDGAFVFPATPLLPQYAGGGFLHPLTGGVPCGGSHAAMILADQSIDITVAPPIKQPGQWAGGGIHRFLPAGPLWLEWGRQRVAPVVAMAAPHFFITRLPLVAGPAATRWRHGWLNPG